MKQNEIFPHLHWQDLSLSILYFVHEKETMPSDHCHAFYELVLVREGQAMHFMNGELARIRAGNIFLVPPGKMHGYRDAQHLGIYNILFSEEILELFQHDLSNTPNYQMLFHVQPGLFSSLRAKTDLLALDHGHFTQAVTLADEIIREENQREAGGRTLVFGEFLHLLACIIRYAHIGGASGKTAGYQISRLLAELDRNFARKWSLADMARFVRMSRSGFRQQFRVMTGVPPVTYLLRLRLEKATALLRLSDSVSEAGMRAGFPDTNYFTRQFRARYGISPREYKRQWKSRMFRKAEKESATRNSPPAGEGT